MIEQAKFTYSVLGKTLEKQIITTYNRGENKLKLKCFKTILTKIKTK